jgi:hypothetical protein
MKACLFALLILMGGVAAADGQPRVLTCGGGNWANGIRIGGPTGLFDPFPELYQPEIRTANADLTGDGVPDIIVGAGFTNHEPLIGVFDGVTATRLASWTTGEPAYTRLSVAAGDVDGDGFADIFVSSIRVFTIAVVRVYSGRNGALLYTRTLDTMRYSYGLEIAAGDVNGDGLADLVLAPGPGLESVVFVLDVASGDTLLQLTPYPGFGSGVHVAVGDVNGDGFADIVTAPDALGGPHVRVFDGRTGDGLASFFAYAPSFSGGVPVTVGDFSGDGRAEILTTGPPPIPGPVWGVTLFDLAAGTNTFWPGTGGSCSTAIPENRLVADTPAQGAHVFGPFRISGWALQQGGTSGTGVETIEVFAAVPGGTPIQLGTATLGDARPDIAARFGNRYADAGFHFTVPRLAPGAYDIIVKASSALTHLVNARTLLRVNVDGPAYQMVLDNPAAGEDGPSPFLVRGWALDLNATNGSGVDAVHVWAWPAGSAGALFCGAATVGLPRPDVAAVFGPQFAGAGFEASCDLPDGTYTIVAYKLSAVTHTFDEQAVVSFRAHGRGIQAMDLEHITVTGLGRAATLALLGWALDGRSLTGSGIDAVHVWAFPTSGGTPVFVGVGLPMFRTDVAQVFGTRFATAGFGGAFAAPPPGTYDVAVYARSAFTGQFDQARVARVTVR